MSAGIETIEFACHSCGKLIRVGAEKSGRTGSCPKCGKPVRVPTLGRREPTPAPPETPFGRSAAGAAPNVVGRPLLRLPSSIGEFFVYLLASWVLVFLACILVSMAGFVAAIVAGAVLVASTGMTAYHLWQLTHARQRVLRQKVVPLFWNLVQMVAWDPTEGVLLLRDKAVCFSDDDLEDGRGGVRFIYPILGEELALRVPLEVQTLRFEDANVLTREYLPLSVRGTIKWRIDDISKFYLLVSRELRHTSDEVGNGSPSTSGQVAEHRAGDQGTVGRLLASAIEWLRIIAEEQARVVVSRVQSGLLIADRLTVEIPEIAERQGENGHAEFGSATAGLARRIFDAVNTQVSGYGIAIEDVSLQEVRVPPEIVEQCIVATKKAYLPTIARRDAARRREELRAEADVIGAEALAAERILANAPAFTLGDFLNSFVANKLGGGEGSADGLLKGVLAANTAAGLLPPGDTEPRGKRAKE